jgi:hypothetical protein
VRADLDGDGQPDSISLDQRSGHLTLVVLVSSTSSTKILEFGVGQSQQAVCRLPVRLSAERLDCEPDGIALPGCRQVQEANTLVLDDGECDAIRVFWDHEKGALGWWRR